MQKCIDSAVIPVFLQGASNKVRTELCEDVSVTLCIFEAAGLSAQRCDCRRHWLFQYLQHCQNQLGEQEIPDHQKDRCAAYQVGDELGPTQLAQSFAQHLFGLMTKLSWPVVNIW